MPGLSGWLPQSATEDQNRAARCALSPGCILLSNVARTLNQ